MVNLLYDILNLLPLSIIPTLWLILRDHPDAPKLVIILIASLITLTGNAFIHIKKSGKLILGGTLISVIVVTLFLISDETRNTLLGEHPWIIPAIVTSVIAFIAGFILCRIRIGKPFVSIVLIVLLAVSMIFHMPPDKIAVCLSFFFIITTIADEIQIRWKKSGSVEKKAHLVFISPFLILFLILVTVFPVSDKPYDWALAKKIYASAADKVETAKEFIQSLGGKDRFDRFIGFSESSTIYSNGKQNSKKVMELRLKTGSVPVVYLTGKTFDHFDGSEWSKTYESSLNDALIDSLETYCAANAYDEETFIDYVKYAQIGLKLLNIHTKHIFSPCKYTKIKNGPNNIDLKYKDGDIFFGKRRSRNYEYLVDYMRLNSDNIVFNDLADAPGTFTQNDWNNAKNTLGLNESEGASYTDLDAYRSGIYNAYLPDINLSPELSSYMDELLWGCDSDIEKLNRIEEMLSTMGYSASTGGIPDDITSEEGFADYFLFHRQSGNCVYYATVFITLSRSIGVPARFVQGYRVPISKESTFTVVTENMSHAWPECYIDGLGWVAFEPTPGYKVYRGWKTSSELSQEKAAYVASAPERIYKPDIETEDIEIEEPEAKNPIDPGTVIIIVAVALSVSAILFAITLLFNSLRYRLSDKEKKYRIMFRKNMTLMEILGIKRAYNETLNEFENKASDIVPDELLSFIKRYEKYIYSESTLTDEDVASIELSNRDLLRFIKDRGFKYRLYMIRYYFMVTSS